MAVLTRFDLKVPGESGVDHKLRRLVAEGRIRLGVGGPVPPFEAPAIGGLSDQVLADRR